MKITNLPTPAILADMNIIYKNISDYQSLANNHSKQLWPMVKTHKSTSIALLQQKMGATGFLCGTLDECEGLADAGIKNIMYAYPVADPTNIQRIISLAEKVNLIIRLDDAKTANILQSAAKNANSVLDYTLILDCGLHRFGVPSNQIATLAREVSQHKNLRYRGISTHAGHVYGASSPEELPKYIEDEKNAISEAVSLLTEAGFTPEIVSSGSTPTYHGTVSDENIGIYHPGNYIFNDNIQRSLGVATINQCALVILATVLSNPAKGHYLIDAGTKCFGLDQGAHGNTGVKGYGYVQRHPSAVVANLSEEVGVIKDSDESLRVGDKIMIIPNHACVPANMTSYIYMFENDEIVDTIEIDMRSNSKQRV